MLLQGIGKPIPKDYPKRIGKYRLLGLLASGGMGEVFLAAQEGPAGFTRTVVVKRILPNLAADKQFLEMFLNEARLAALLNHPNVVQIYELGEDDGSFFLAMEHVNGKTLRVLSRLTHDRKQKIPFVVLVRVLSQALAGLHHAHTLTDAEGRPLGIIHRDVSPDNILVGYNGAVKLLDFGVAKATQAISTTHKGTLKGKLSYMAPEQIMGEPVDARGDVYSAGVVLYELVSGVKPFTGATEGALLKSVIECSPIRLEHITSDVPVVLANIIHRAMSKRPSERFSSAEEMSEALEQTARSNLLGSHAVKDVSAQLQISTFVKDNFPPLNVASPTTSQAETGEVRIHVSSSFENEIESALPQKTKALRLRFVVLVSAAFVLLMLGMSWWVHHQAIEPIVAKRAHLSEPSSRPLGLQAVNPKRRVEKQTEFPQGVLSTDSPSALEPNASFEKNEPNSAVEVPRKKAKGGVKNRTVERGVKINLTGRVDLRVNPWAEVFVEGQSLGLTPMQPISLKPGKHEVVLKNTELNVQRRIRVEVEAEKTSVIRIDLLADESSE